MSKKANTCKDCPPSTKPFADQASWIQHVREKHPQSKQLNAFLFCGIGDCRRSSRTFANKGALQDHVQQQHTGQVNQSRSSPAPPTPSSTSAPRYTCQIAGCFAKPFSTSIARDQHFQAKHGDVSGGFSSGSGWSPARTQDTGPSPAAQDARIVSTSSSQLFPPYFQTGMVDSPSRLEANPVAPRLEPEMTEDALNDSYEIIPPPTPPKNLLMFLERISATVPERFEESFTVLRGIANDLKSSSSELEMIARARLFVIKFEETVTSVEGLWDAALCTDCQSAVAADQDEITQFLRRALPRADKNLPILVELDLSDVFISALIAFRRHNTTQSDPCLRFADNCVLKLTILRNHLPKDFFLSGVNKHAYLDNGGFGVVFEGRYGEQPVALKFIPDERVSDSSGSPNSKVAHIQREFFREVVTLWLLDHPNIIPFLGVAKDDQDDKIYIVTPFMAKGTAKSFLKAKIPALAKEDAQKLIRRLVHDFLHGMLYLHERRSPIVHGDLKPNNLLIDDDDHLRIADFGLSFLAREAVNTTTRGSGTDIYKAPELTTPYGQEKHGSRKSLATDLFAIALSIWEFYTCKTPTLPGMKTAEFMQALRDQKRPSRPLESEGDRRTVEMPLDVWDAVQVMWRHNPSERGTIADALRRLHY